MRKEEETRAEVAVRRKAAELARLTGLFLNASSGSIAYELAERMLAVAGNRAVPFLLQQTAGGGHRAEAAIAALQAAPDVSGEALVRALDAAPNSQHLARALPQSLSRVLIRRLTDLVPEVTEAATLRYLTQRLADASPQSVPDLREAQRQCEDADLELAICVGLAAAGEAPALAGLQERLPHAPNHHVRLMLSCRPLATSPAGAKALRKLLRSDSAGDRAQALRTIAGVGAAALVKEVAQVFVSDEDEGVVYEALEALRVVQQKLTRPQLDGVLRRACDLSELADLRNGKPCELAVKAGACAKRLTRVCELNAHVDIGDPHLLLPVILAATHAVGFLTPHLIEADPLPEVMEAASRLLGLQREGATLLWQVDRRRASAPQIKLGGALTVEMLRAWGWETNDQAPQELLDDLAAECQAGAAFAVRVLSMEYPQRDQEHADGQVARNALRRVALLAKLGLRAGIMPATVETLRASRQREVAAIAEAEQACGTEELPKLQAEFDQRLLRREEPAQLAGGYVRRRDRGRTRECPSEIGAALLTEQVLQADLCVWLGLRPLTSHAVRQLISLQGSRSAVVRAAAQAALASHPEETGQLRQRLTQETDTGIQARLLEILRCLGSPRSLSFARRALESHDELLQAAALRYLQQFGKLSDLTPHRGTLEAASEFVKLVALKAVMGLMVGPQAALVKSLIECLGDLSPAKSLLAEQALFTHPGDVVAKALVECVASDNALVRVRARRLLDRVEAGWPGGEVAAAGGVTAPVTGDDVLGQTLMLSGEAPFQWGLPALPVALPPRLDEYYDLLREDDALTAHWDEWFATGVSPLHLLPDLHARATSGKTEAEAAIALGLDIIGSGVERYLASFIHYHRLPVDDGVEQRVDRVLREVFRRCTPAAMDSLQAPNPSNNALFSEALATSMRGELAGPIFCLTFAELLKKALFDEFMGETTTAPTEDGSVFRRYVEREWDDLKRFPDDYYGYWVWPRLSLAEMGRYCSSRGAGKRYRLEITSYLGYLATSLPAFRERTQEARAALGIALDDRLKAAARSIANEQRRDAGEGRQRSWDHVEEEIRGRLQQRFDKAVATFDVHWLPPHPIFPLGTLPMAWEAVRRQYGGGTELFPESHVSFANLIEKSILQLVREERPKRKDGLIVGSLDAPFPDDDGAEEPGLSREEQYEDRQRFLAQIADGEDVDEIVSDVLRHRPTTKLSTHPQDIMVDGRPVQCWDIQQAEDQLGHPRATLKRHSGPNGIRFVREGIYWYLPVEELERARVVLRTRSQWARELKVCAQTVRNWMNDIPEDTDPLEMDRLLRERKKDTRGRKPQRKYKRAAH